MESIKVAINGFGTIGKRVADAVDAQDDMEIIGVTKTGPSFGCDLAVKKGFPLYCTFDDAERIAAFSEQGYQCKGGLSDLLSVADVVIDCAPERWAPEILQNTKRLESNIFSKVERSMTSQVSHIHHVQTTMQI